MTVTLVLAESALQLIPASIRSHPQIRRYASRREKDPGQVLLDRAFHHSAMKSLARRSSTPIEKMGRPDIVHSTLLQVLETPLNWEERLRVFIHTQDEFVISVNSKIRLPKNYVRFVGLIEQLFAEERVPAEAEPLLELKRSTLPELISTLAPDRVIGFSTLGKSELLREVTDSTCKFKNPVAFIGAFPRGHFTDSTRRLMDATYCIDSVGLDSCIVAGRFVYDYECSIGLGAHRLNNPR